MEFHDKLSELKYMSEFRYDITFQVFDCNKINGRIISLFLFKNVPVVSSAINTETLEVKLFAYEEEKLPVYVLEEIRKITNQIKNQFVFSVFS